MSWCGKKRTNRAAVVIRLRILPAPGFGQIP
jgi:hypothetical protein